MKGDKRKMPLVCHFCGEVGHKAGKTLIFIKKYLFIARTRNVTETYFAIPAQCPKIPSEAKDIYRTPADASQPPQNPRDRNNLRPLDEVTCYRVIKLPLISLKKSKAMSELNR